MNIRLAGIEPYSVVDGPGIRYAIYVQGCLHQCKQCHNPQTHDMNGGYITTVEEVIKDIESEHKEVLSGITISGGDPLEWCGQFYSTEELCKKLKEEGYNIWLYTGYRYEQLQYLDILNYIDVLVDGEFHIDEKSPNIVFRGSSNQRIIDVQESLKQRKAVDISERYDRKQECD